MADSDSAGLMQRWDDIRVLLAVCRAGTFTRAASLLRTDQSTVSRRIATLEEELNVQLFERGPRGLVPTPMAESMRAIAERIEGDVGRMADVALDQREQPVRGRVRLALTEEMATLVVIPAVIPALREAYPELAIDLITSYRTADLMGHEADVALRFFRSKRGDLVGKKIAEFPTGILCARERARSWKKKAPGELPWTSVHLEGLSSFEAEWLQGWLKAAPVLTCSSYHVQLAAVRAGIGVGVGPSLIPELDPSFVELPAPGLALPKLELFLLTRRAIRHLPRIARVLEAIERGFQDLPKSARAPRSWG
jgi:DNA-binding transcriptional LysR family regulator